jgi:signal peptidase I
LKVRAIAGGIVLSVVFLILLAINYEVIRFYVVVSDSMEPTLQIGDRILVDSSGSYGRYSIISFRDPTRAHDPDEILVKRIIGIGGDSIRLRDGELIINGEYQYSPNVTSDIINWPDVNIEVPPNHVFVLGDNRNNSFDSLNFGPIPEEKIIGVLTSILWPFDRWGRVGEFEVQTTP